MVTFLSLCLAGIGMRAVAKPATFAVTTSWLECCLRDVGGEDMGILRICPPGTCPGHFDLTPGTLAQLASCRALFLFSFQESLDARLGRLKREGLDVVSVEGPAGLCVPDNYLAGCDAVGAALVARGVLTTETCSTALARTGARLDNLARDVRARLAASGLRGTPVAASRHQADFCRWLGLEVAVEFGGRDAATPTTLEDLVARGKDAQVSVVVSNLAEGTQFAQTLARELGGEVVVFGNFPSMAVGQTTFDELVEANVRALLRRAGEGAR